MLLYLGLEGVKVASENALKITPIEPGTYEEYKLDENEKVEFVKKERFHSIGNFPKYDVNVTVTGKCILTIPSEFSTESLYSRFR